MWTGSDMNDDPEPDELPTTVDVLRYPEGDEYLHKAVPADDGPKVVGAHDREAAQRKKARLLLYFLAAAVSGAAGVYLAGPGLAILSLLAVVVASSGYEYVRTDPAPEVIGRNVHAEEAVNEYGINEYVCEPSVE